ncbi:GGDEF domain-containing protein [Acinetobacter rongchengensis]|uniref:diguanylate cyclase n=1 Tax=Acinetobacter rongchengensis TaxID=2419601 RepID=A0A3A8EVN6_9GAMM|nr:GGDEF domain-containing protein [Acinetobacter rongchengensis]RKG38907.1 GGDEF domain-containing protein [Acinetobacter rongchengensis]
MRNKVYSKRRRKIHSLFNQVLKTSFISKLMGKSQLDNHLEIDSVTGIYNQFAINNYLKELHPQPEANFGIILLSIDNLKQVKEKFNQKIADKALLSTAQQLTHHIRDTDLVGRYSESEFIIILGDVTQDQAIGIADRLTKLINKNALKANRKNVSLKASCGVSVSEKDSISDNVLQQADQALYLAKTNGVSFYSNTHLLS